MRTTVAATAALLAMLQATTTAAASIPDLAPPPVDLPGNGIPEGATTMSADSAAQVPVEATTMTPLFVPVETGAAPGPAPIPNAQVAPPAPVEATGAAIVAAPVAEPLASAEIPATQRESSTVSATGPTPLLLKDNTAATPSTGANAATPTAANGNGNSDKNDDKNKTSSPRDTDMGAGDGSDLLDTSLSYACVCKDVRKVSLMSASDYCLSPAAVIGNKCGNAAVGEKGECPLAGAQPCQDTGHVLENNSICAFDKRDETYKCVASAEDLYIQKNGKKKKKTSLNSTSKPPSAGGSSDAASARVSTSTVMRTVLLVASLAVGLAAVA